MCRLATIAHISGDGILRQSTGGVLTEVMLVKDIYHQLKQVGYADDARGVKLAAIQLHQRTLLVPPASHTAVYKPNIPGHIR